MLKKLIHNGNLEDYAYVYEKKEHKINNNLIDPDALKIINKIKSLGEEAYLVGGAVRDLILGKKPKDFDIATSMTPNELKRQFRNVRIIGHRFKLAHFIFPNKKIIEVATFRSIDSKNNVNLYGNIEEDVQRRDFTINALYYDPFSTKIYDYIGGYSDLINEKKIKPIINLDKIFKEDPVRIIRAIKYSIKDNLSIEQQLYKQIIEDSNCITDVSPSRLYEELIKIFVSGQSFEIFKNLQKVGILNYILPKISYDIKIDNPILIANAYFFDTIVNNFNLSKDKIIELGVYSLIAHIYNKINTSNIESAEVIKRDIFTNIKIIFRHFNIPNKIIEHIVGLLINRTSIFLYNDSNVGNYK